MMRKNTNSMSFRWIVLLAFVGIAQISYAQVPATTSTNGAPLFNLFGTQPKKTEPVKPSVSNEKIAVKSVAATKKVMEEDSGILPTPIDVQLSEFDVARLELEKQKVTLQKELDELYNGDKQSLQDSLIIKIKKENLRLVYLQEQHLLKEELKSLGAGPNVYGSSGIYGHHFFRAGGIKFYQKSKDAIPSNGYILGPEDRLHIEAWGNSQLSTDIEIGDDGYAELPFGRRVYLNGLTLGQGKELLRVRLGQMVNANSISINIVSFRSITVHVIGEVFKPGSYVIPAMNTAFNALTIMGGPNNIGSVRNIKIKRNGKIIDSLDVYSYMMNSEKSREIYLQNNDYIIVEPLQKVIGLKGAVRRPGRYELKKWEDLDDLIEIAAGVTPTAYLKDVLVSRITDNEKFEQIALDYNLLLEEKKKFALYNGDNIEFKAITNDEHHLVSIEGAVNIPGSYRLSKTAKIKDLIQQANGFLKEAYIGEAYIIRTDENYVKNYIKIDLSQIDDANSETNKIELLPYDIIHVFSKKNYLNMGTVEITGAVKRPFNMTFAEGMTIRDAILVAGGFRIDAYLEEAYIIRIDADYVQTFLRVNLNDSSISNNDLDIALEPYDKIHVFSKRQFLNLGFVTINGAVREPQTIPFANDMRLKDLILVAGGLRVDSYLERGIITRVNETTNERQTIIFDVNEVIGDNPSDQNILLEKNDEVEIFSKIQFRDSFTVNITGEVHSPGEFVFGQNMTLKDLIFKAGGLSTSAINSKIEIVRSFKFGEDMIRLEPIPAEVIVMEIGAVLDLKKEFEDFVMYPFDQVSIRKNPYYLESRKVTLTGAVFYPGEYTLLSEDEKLSSLIERAGGLRSYAFPEGLEFKRGNGEDGVTDIITNLKKALRRPNSSYNYILLEGDEINIPIANDLVSISGNIMNEDKERLSIYYKRHRRAKHYITKYAGGFKERSMKRKTYVKYADGTAKRTKNYLFFKIYPKPRPGSEIFVIRNKKTRKKFSLGSSFEDTTTKLTAVLTLVLMYAVVQASLK